MSKHLELEHQAGALWDGIDKAQAVALRAGEAIQPAGSLLN